MWKKLNKYHTSDLSCKKIAKISQTLVLVLITSSKTQDQIKYHSTLFFLHICLEELTLKLWIICSYIQQGNTVSHPTFFSISTRYILVKIISNSYLNKNKPFKVKNKQIKWHFWKNVILHTWRNNVHPFWWIQSRAIYLPQTEISVTQMPTFYSYHKECHFSSCVRHPSQ